MEPKLRTMLIFMGSSYVDERNYKIRILKGFRVSLSEMIRLSEISFFTIVYCNMTEGFERENVRCRFEATLIWSLFD